MESHRVYINFRSMLIFVIFYICYSSSASKILFAPYPDTSPVIQLLTVASALKAKGHTVFIVMPKSYPKLDQLKKEFTVIDYNIKYPDAFMLPLDWMKKVLDGSPARFFQQNNYVFIPFCTNPLEDDELLERIRKVHIDFAIVDGGRTRCYMILMHKLGIPYATFANSVNQDVCKTPLIPSFIPFILAGIYTERMTFVERIRNLYAFLDWTVINKLPQFDDEFVRKYLPEAPSSVTYNWLFGKSVLFFRDSDFVIDYPRPIMPNEVFIGGITTRPARPLSDNLSKFADASEHGLIIVAFGTGDTQLGEMSSFKKFVDAFSRLPEYRFVWRYSGDIDQTVASKIPSNVLIMKWIPQNDLLGHNNTRLLVTHCGTNSQFEAIYHGIPLLCFPFWSDQAHNSRRMAYMGYGRHLNLRNFTSVEMVNTLRELVKYNSTYRYNTMKASSIFMGRPETPLERSVYWVEYAIEHGGERLRSHAFDLDWYEYWMVDIFALLIVVPLMTVTALVTCCLCVCYNRRISKLDKFKLN